jgi:hypothetical protein
MTFGHFIWWSNNSRNNDELLNCLVLFFLNKENVSALANHQQNCFDSFSIFGLEKTAILIAISLYLVNNPMPKNCVCVDFNLFPPAVFVSFFSKKKEEEEKMCFQIVLGIYTCRLASNSFINLSETRFNSFL